MVFESQMMYIAYDHTLKRLLANNKADMNGE